MNGSRRITLPEKVVNSACKSSIADRPATGWTKTSRVACGQMRLTGSAPDSNYLNDPGFRFAPVRADAGADVGEEYRRRWRSRS